MTIKELGTNWDETYRNDLNNNFKELSDEIAGGVSRVGDGAVTTNAISPSAVTNEKVANNAINYQKLNMPEAQLIDQNRVEVNFKTRKLIISQNCFISVEGTFFNLAPTQNIEFSLPIENDGYMFLITFNYQTKIVSYKKYTDIVGQEVVIAYIYKKRVYGKNTLNILCTSDNPNYDYLSEQNVQVFNQNIVSDTIDYTKLKLSSAFLVNDGYINVDFQKLTLTIKAACYAMIQERTLNLNASTTKENLVLSIPSEQSVTAHMVVVDISTNPVTVSIEKFSTTNTQNKRILLYIFKSKIYGPNVPFINVINSFGKKDKREAGQPTKVIAEHLSNPFVRTKIKLIGDSITAGLCGTGYSATDKAIGNTGFKTNVTTAVCWANMLRDHILNEYSKDVDVAVNDPGLSYSSNTHTISENNNTTCKWQVRFANTTAANGIKFDFHGDHLSIIYASLTGGGIMDIFIDGAKWGELDTYSASYADNIELKVTGLTLGKHSFEIREANKKNASSTSNTVYIQGLKIPKTVDVVNFGISGKHSQYLYQNRTQLIEVDDDLIIMQIGTNDRHNFKTTAVTKAYHREIIKYVQGLGLDIVIMSANPVSVANDMEAVRNFKMDDVDRAIASIAKEFNMSYVSNYKWFMDYAVNTGVTVDSLLFDGLHPNDTGYRVMFENIAAHLGLTLLRDGISYI